MSQRRTQRQLSDEVEPDLTDSIKECVRFIICREGSKIPIKRNEIGKYLSSNFSTPNNLVNTVIAEANKVLKRVYGYKLVQVEVRSGVQYILVLTEDCDSMPTTATDPYLRKLLIAALMHIFMTGGPVKEEELWRFLEEAGLLEENDHSTRKLFTSMFTKTMYLTHSKVGEGDMAVNVFEIGQRATEEVSKMFLLNKMAEAFDKNPDNWFEQFKTATEERGEAS